MSVPARMAFDAGRAEWLEHAVIERAELSMVAAVAGPALIVEDQTTTVVAAGFVVGLDSGGNLVLQRALGPDPGKALP